MRIACPPSAVRSPPERRPARLPLAAGRCSRSDGSREPGQAPACSPLGAIARAQRAASVAAGREVFELSRPRDYLDLWDAYSGPATYTGFIGSIDTLLGGAATKATIGTAADGTTPIHGYTAGAERAPHALLVGGTHGHEEWAMYAAMRFFTVFATSQHPAMVSLRSRCRLTWVPALNSSSYRGTRMNSAGVDVNRNWPWAWKWWNDATPDRYKGTAPMTQPENLALKAVLDASPIGMVVDCHTSGPADPVIAYTGPSWSIHAQRTIFYSSAQRWATANAQPAPTYWNGSGSITPSMESWAGKYLRFDKARQNAAALLIEGRAGIGSSPAGSITREGARLYASFIYHAIDEWLLNGQRDVPPTEHLWWAYQDASDTTSAAASITAGGRLIDNTTYAPAAFNFDVTSSAGRNYLGVPIRHPGSYLVEWSANVEAVAGAPLRVDGRLGFAEMTTDGSPVALATRGSGYLQLAAGEWGTLTGRAHFTIPTVPDDASYMAQVNLRVNAAGQQVLIRPGTGLWLTVKAYPNFEPWVRPLVSRT